MRLENVYFVTNLENTQQKCPPLHLALRDKSAHFSGCKNMDEQRCHHQKFLKTRLKLAKNNRVMFA